MTGAKRHWFFLPPRVVGFRQGRTDFSHELSFQIDFVGVVNQAVQDGIGQCQIADMLDPVFNGDLGRRARGSGRGAARAGAKIERKIAYDRI